MSLFLLLFCFSAEAKLEHFHALHLPDLLQKDEPEIAEAIAIGKRFFLWTAFQNEKLSATEQIRITSAEDQSEGISIEQPALLSLATLSSDLKETLSLLPDSVKTVLQSTDPFPDQLPVEASLFISYGQSIHVLYESALRWKLKRGSIPYYRQERVKDVRGYHYLKRNGWNEEKLSHWSQVHASEQEYVKGWLIGECMNSAISHDSCFAKLNAAIAANQIVDFYQTYHPKAEETWNSFFTITPVNARNDIKLNSANGRFLLSFQRPTLVKIQDFLKKNIEDEWKLNLTFVDSDTHADIPSVIFANGETPHVDSVGGNHIIMDATIPTEEFETQWNIRHEFGHVLGFPDCYLEFYDDEQEGFLYYELDTTDIMCSAAGHAKDRHFNELKRVYSSP